MQLQGNNFELDLSIMIINIGPRRSVASGVIAHVLVPPMHDRFFAKEKLYMTFDGT